MRAAERAHDRELALKLALAGLPRQAGSAELLQVLERGGSRALANLTVAWDHLGRLAQARGDGLGAVEACSRQLEVALLVARSKVAASAGSQRGRAHGSWRAVANAHRGIGAGLLRAGEPEAALAAHRAELAVCGQFGSSGRCAVSS